MATTTNYGWTTPDDTALVKDGASAIRTLGTSVDTTTKNLNPETTLGDIAYRSSTSNVNTRLGIGSAGQVLTVASGVPSWATASSGGMTLLSTTTLSGTSTTISSISGAYNNLQIVISGSVGAGLPAIRPNGSATITYGAVQINSTNSTISANVWYFTAFEQTNNAGQITIYNYASTSLKKPFFSTVGYGANGKIVSGFIDTTSAITSIEINGSGDTFTGGQVLIYGVK